MRRVYIKNIIFVFAVVFILFVLASCSKKNSSSIKWMETEVDPLIYDSFKSSIDERGKLILVEIHDGKIYLGNRLIYMDDLSAAADGFRVVTMLSQSFLVNKNRQFNSNYAINPFLFSSDIQKIIMTIDGSKWDDKLGIDEVYFNIINDAGLYSISGVDEDIVRVLNKELLYKYCEERYDGTWINTAGVTDIDKKELVDINNEIKANSKVVKDADNIYKFFVIKNESTFPEYKNYFNKDGYAVVDSFIVQSKDAVEHMNALSTFDRADYQAIEREVFKLNNKEAVVYDDKTYTMTIYKKGEFLSNGKPAWVTRVNGEEAVDIYGNKLYADCGKTFDEFKIYCGGTDVAFRGWKDEMIDNPDEFYLDILKGNATWDDSMFVDEQVKHLPIRNDDPKYYEEYIEEIKTKEKEALDKYVNDRLEQIESK